MPGPSPSAHQVLVYSGPGVSPLSLSHTVLTLSLLLLPHYTVQPVTPSALASEPWESSCALLVVPGGRDLPYVEELETKSRATRRIREWVNEGGQYLGICAGAYFASEEVRFDVGGEMEVRGKRDLAFFPGICEGPTYPGFQYAAESGSRAVSLILDSPSRAIDHLYYNGGGHFRLPSPVPSNITVLARYADPPSSSSSSSDLPVAAVLTRHGAGRALLCSIHFEYPLQDPPARDAISKLADPPSIDDIKRSEAARIEWAAEMLETLGLKPPGRRKTHQTEMETVGGEVEDPQVLLHPTHPSPIFVVSHPALPDLPEESFSAEALRSKYHLKGEERILRDGNDELHIVSVNSLSTSDSDLTSHLAHLRRATPSFTPSEPPIDKLSLSSTSSTPQPEPPQPPDLHSLPKTLILPSPSLPYSPNWTPLFNLSTYYSELDAARKRYGRRSGVLRKGADGKERPGLGDLLWYGESVTSTQTMLDRNPLLLTHLPTPLAFLASFQLSGRGRGSNIWLSPPGCLQFSLMLTLPSRLASKLVFIQYLMALAVCEAVDESGKLGVRIKWPNDLYGEAEGLAGTEVGSGQRGKAKLGGILVNTNFVGGEWRVVVGTGINVLNPLPTTSLSQVHSLYAARHAQSGGTANLPPPPTMEGTFAKIMCAFESKWEQFIDDGGFEGLESEYYGRWLHSGQEVTLTTTTPHIPLRILGITPDQGLLRCERIATTTNTNSTVRRGLPSLFDRDTGGDDRYAAPTAAKKAEDDERYVDLQPDGNSFDMMSGLIKRKV